MDGNREKKPTTEDLDFLMIQYQVLANRELNHDTLMWDTPSLLFVCQTLLWGIALDNTVELFFRCAVSLVSILIGVVSYQLFLRHRLMVIADAEQLYSIEQYLAKQTCGKMSLTVYQQLKKRTVISGKSIKKVYTILQNKPQFQKNPFSRISSFVIWECVFGALVVLSVVIFVYNVYLLATFVNL